jgi:hypothetical protein
MALDISQLPTFKKNKIEIMLHTGEGGAGLNHIRYWLKEFMNTKVDFCILVRNVKLFKALSTEFKFVTILLATSPLEVESVVTNIKHLKSIFYTSNTGNNIHLLRFIDYKHISIATEHSDRDSKITKFMKSYDETWVSSDAVIDKIKSEIDITYLNLVKIGKPQLYDLISNNQQKIENKILYLSSAEGETSDENFSSLTILPQLINNLSQDGFLFDFVLDKATGGRDKNLISLENDINEFSYVYNYNYTFSKALTNDLLLKNKYIICDIKTFSNSMLASGAIILLFLPADKSIEQYIFNKYMNYDFVYTFSNVKYLNKHIHHIKEGNDNMFELREKAIDYWVGTKEILSNKFQESVIKEIKL